MGAPKLAIVSNDLEIDKKFYKEFESYATRSSYENDLNQFVEFIASNYPDISSFAQISRDEVIEFRDMLL